MAARCCTRQRARVRVAVVAETLAFAARASQRANLPASTCAGHGELVEHLIQRGAAVNTSDDEARCACLSLAPPEARSPHARARSRLQGWTPLMSAASTGSMRVVNLLLGVGAEVNATNSGGRSAVFYAASKGHAPVLQLLLDAGADVSVRDSVGATPLHRAAGAGKDAAIRQLLAAGASLEAVDAQGATPVLVAALAGQEQACIALAAAGANLGARDREGNTLSSLVPRLGSVMANAAAGMDVGGVALGE
jgi:ankyrin repeat protein